MELVILIGLQGSGKSSFRRSRFDETHAVVSKDNFRSNKRPARRQEQLIRVALQAGMPVVVDNTNPRREDRAALVALAREYSVRVIGYFLRSSYEDCRERNSRREGTACVPDIGLKSTAKVLVVPDWSEGFDELYDVVMEPPDGFKTELMQRGLREDG
jgi:predicted kinase